METNHNIECIEDINQNSRTSHKCLTNVDICPKVKYLVHPMIGSKTLKTR